MQNQLSKVELKAYNANGYIMKKGLLNNKEVTRFREKARFDLENQINENGIMQKGDKEGNVTLLKMWYTAKDDTYGLIARK